MRPTPPLRPRTRASPGGAATTQPGSRGYPPRADHLSPEDQQQLVEEVDAEDVQEERVVEN